MEGKNIIYFYRDWWDFLEDLDMQQRGEWITYVMQYVNDLSRDLPNDKQVMSICKITRNPLTRDLEDWKKMYLILLNRMFSQNLKIKLIL